MTVFYVLTVTDRDNYEPFVSVHSTDAKAKEYLYWYDEYSWDVSRTELDPAPLGGNEEKEEEVYYEE